MNAEDLMIGNFVSYDNDTYVVTEISCQGTIQLYNEDTTIEVKDTEIRPIEINGVWLKMFGFIHSNIDNRVYNKKIGELIDINVTMYLCSDTVHITICDICDCREFDIQYLHELQNITRVTTGKTLEPDCKFNE